LRGKLLEDEKKARKLVLGKSQFEVKDGVLYHVEKNKTLRVVPLYNLMGIGKVSTIAYHSQTDGLV